MRPLRKWRGEKPRTIVLRAVSFPTPHKDPINKKQQKVIKGDFVRCIHKFLAVCLVTQSQFKTSCTRSWNKTHQSNLSGHLHDDAIRPQVPEPFSLSHAN